MMEPRPPNVVVHGHRLPPPPNRVALTPSSVLAMVRASVATPSSAISRGRSHCLGEHAHERGQPAPEMGAAAVDRSPSSPASAVSGGSGGGPKPNSRGTDLCCQRRAVVLPSMDKDASIGGQRCYPSLGGGCWCLDLLPWVHIGATIDEWLCCRRWTYVMQGADGGATAVF
jgi:hypothetical protein